MMIHLATGFFLAALFAAAAPAQPDPSGIEFVTIGAPGNPAWAGNGTPGDFAIGRGSVGYEYKIGKYEVTTAQWVEFFNAAFDRPADDRIPHLSPPGHWGAAPAAPNTPGGLRWQVPAGNEMLPVGNISWRMGAIYCNWLENDKSVARAAFLDGAYDVSTFGFTPGGTWTDQQAHHPGARYWIPTWDEHLKASHFDPNGGGLNGWWRYNNGSDTPPVYGPPGSGEANSGFDSPNPFGIPLGAYGPRGSWGLYDTAGGTAEWTESIRTLVSGNRYRVYDGSWWTQDAVQAPGTDSIAFPGNDSPHIPTYDHGLRIASIPGPGSAVCLGVLTVFGAFRPRRSTCSCASFLPRSPLSS